MAFENHKRTLYILNRMVGKLPEEVLLDIEILGSRRDSLISSQKIRTSLIIFKRSAMNLWKIDMKSQTIKDILTRHFKGIIVVLVFKAFDGSTCSSYHA